MISFVNNLVTNLQIKVANVIFLDAPTLTGYSYANTTEAARASDTSSASQTLEFIRKVCASFQS